MAQEADTPQAAAAVQLEGSTYEIIRNRLNQQAKELRARLDRLNDARREVFGTIETKLLSTERITTDHNCVPRDMVAIGDRFLFGYNVHLGLKTETALSDVFAVYQFRDRALTQQPLDLIADPQFERDFKEIYRYYRHATFAKFSILGPHLFMVFRVGPNPSDIKTFKWALQGGKPIYLDNRSDHEFRLPPQHEFEWIRTTREWHRTGMHPHISIQDRVFVETVGGDLTIKIENNTDSGAGIYAEEVDNKDQTLDDAEIYYALVGNLILLKIRPYQENAFRYIVYSEKVRRAIRLDSIANACVLLPDDHGIIFPDGYYLQTGEVKVFEGGLTDMLFERRLAAPNGEDFLFVFYNRDSGDHVLLRYNLIEQTVETPIRCHGATFFPGGELVCFKAQAEPQKHHALQIWQTPYVAADYVTAAKTDSFLYKIGNRDLVRGMAECQEILNLIAKEDTYANLFVDLAKLAGDVKDSYFWIGNPDCFNLGETLGEIRNAATAAIDEFEKVVRVRRNTAAETDRVRQQVHGILATSRRKRFEHVNDFVSSLADLRRSRGETIALRDLRYIDLVLVDALEKEIVEQADRLAHRCVQFLLQPAALQPYEQRIRDDAAKIDALERVADAKQLEADVMASAGELEMLIEIVSNLKIDDATHRITIIDNISAIFARVNSARAALKRKTKELLSVEGVAEFNSQLRLLNQSVVNFLDVSDSPEKCDEFLTKLMVQIEELEGRFAEFDEFVLQLTEKREEVYNAFESRKVQLVEARNQRAAALQSAAERILKGIKSRVETLTSINDIHGYFASDLMIEKVRGLVAQLKELGDSVKVDDIQSRLKTVREDAVRQLKDRQDLFVEGEMIIRLGQHRFSVNAQPLDLTTVLRDGQMLLHLTGTNFFQPIEDQDLLATRDVWDQHLVSENREVYRAEYLAFQFLSELYRPVPEGTGAGVVYGQDAESQTDEQPENGSRPLSAGLTPKDLLACDDQPLTAHVQRFMAPRYEEAYSKGVHDHDAAILLRALLEMKTTIGLLRFQTRARAMARVFWRHFGDPADKQRMAATLHGFGTVVRLFPQATAQTQYVADLRTLLAGFAAQTQLYPDFLVDEAAEYLFCELTGANRAVPAETTRGTDAQDAFIVSRRAAELAAAFQRHLEQHNFADVFGVSLAAVMSAPVDRVLLLRDWIEAFLEQRPETQKDDWEYVDEVVACVLDGPPQPEHIVDGQVTRDLSGLAGSHALTGGGRYHLNYNRFMFKLDQFERRVVPLYRSFVRRKKELVDAARDDMKLDEFRPRVLTSFVRNKLIDEVYLPLVGDNLAKQIGVAGEQKRTDRMGLLLVISPPGYGKTTLMEYIANRLGLIFMKINGPAIGHRVTSLDPAEAPNAAAREELHRLNLAFEMGDNVMLYVDDIQHCHAEFLQKFISLCDAQRKIEGVYQGRTRTYDLRGRKVCVVMAGNPYTESGEKFRIPDMLSNRADIYNLGEIIGDTQDVFEMSYLENCLTSNPVLNKLAARSQKDVYGILRIAAQNSREGVELEGNYASEEINEMVSVMQKLMRVRDIVLSVNREYIRSAAQADAYRTEPPFLLQGSYRNMNRIAEKVLPIMNDRELQTLIVSNYENDAQTLTTNAESNLLKFKDLMGVLTPDEARRWSDIKRTFQQNVKMQGVAADDQVGRVIVQLRDVGDGLHAIRESLGEGVKHLAKKDTDDDKVVLSALLQHVGELRRGLEAIGTALKEAATQAAEHRAEPTVRTAPPEPLSQRVIVQHRVPRELLDVVKSQFDVMNTWLEPLLAASEGQRRDLNQLQGAVQTCLANYDGLLQQLESAQTRGSQGESSVS
jgi:hypothetical protein